MSKHDTDTSRGGAGLGAVKVALQQPVRAGATVADHLPSTRDELSKTVQALRLRASTSDYIEYYRQLQDIKVQQDDAYPRNGVGPAQFEFLTNHGLEPSDRLLDIGCGDLRGGQFAIDYLEPGNYIGMDISAAAIGKAVTLVDQQFPDKDPRLFVNDDLRLHEIERDSIDYALAQSVFTHLPPEHVTECLEHVPRVLTDDGVFYATFHEAEEYHAVPSFRTSGSDSMRYPFEMLREMADDAGLEAERVPYPEYPTDEMDMAAFRPQEGDR